MIINNKTKTKKYMTKVGIIIGVIPNMMNVATDSKEYDDCDVQQSRNNHRW